MPQTLAKKFLRYWLPALLWLGFIISTSSDAFSSQHTGNILEWLMGELGIGLAPSTFDLLHLVIRKSAHFVEYVLLSGLWYRVWQAGRSGWRAKSALLALAVCLAMASLDEWHQSVLPSRTGAVHDVLLDFSGALFVQLVIAWRARRPLPAA